MQIDRAAYYERAYWRKFIALYASIGRDLRDSAGRLWVRREPEEASPTRPDFPAISNIYRRREVRWVVGYRGDVRLPAFSHLQGLVCLIEFGGPSQLRLDITFQDGLCHLNGVSLTGLYMRRKQRGDARWTTRLYFQIDCRAELAALDAVRAVKRLWRSSYKSYFSWLPREIVVYIQTLGHFLTAPRQTCHCPKSS